MSGSIKTIRLGAPALPTYDTSDGHSRMFWGGADEDIDPNGSLPVIRVLQRGQYDISLTFGAVSWYEQIPAGTTSAVVQGYLQPDGSDTIETEPCTAQGTVNLLNKDSISLSATLAPARQELPWGLHGTIHWSLDNGGTRLELGQTPIELYFIGKADMPDFLFRGVPVELFRKFLLPLRLMQNDPDIGAFNSPTLHRDIQDTRDGWLTYVTDKLHYQKSTRYDVNGGGSSHYFNGGSAPIRLDFWVHDTATTDMHVLNCYDLAGLMDVILPLGLNDSANVLQMNPFGPDLVTDVNDPKRSAFGTHVFMTIADAKNQTERVLDATCRPLDVGPHDGREAVPDYLKASIDDTTALYQMPEAEFLSKGGRADHAKLTGEDDLRYQLGKFSDTDPKHPVNWDGVNKLYTRPEIFHPTLLDPQNRAGGVLASVKQIFGSCPGCDPRVGVDANAVTAEWCLDLGGQPASLTIASAVTRYDPKELFAQAMKEINGDYRAVSPADADSGIALWQQDNYFIQFSMDSRAELASYVQKLSDMIAGLPAPTPLNISVAMSGSGSYSVGETFTATVSGLPDDIVPLDLDITGTDVLYLSSSISGSSATFTFLARDTTDDGPNVIEISSWGTGLTWQTAGPQKVSITA
ncbi:unnamed protein product [Parascedosporium putredinis]|uniref:Uncharacterized protein n=1 Tax=Parascedosporium putredinis TaxID=1442378 RepID=A0A9P1HB44_9PEZI|nr:unnamed protein product [Parascedosporium putredinis]CAI8001787.1 unnamed protein product [Parascedosporium putredinis]